MFQTNFIVGWYMPEVIAVGGDLSLEELESLITTKTQAVDSRGSPRR
jgi:hypothetical protein